MPYQDELWAPKLWGCTREGVPSDFRFFIHVSRDLYDVFGQVDVDRRVRFQAEAERSVENRRLLETQEGAEDFQFGFDEDGLRKFVLPGGAGLERRELDGGVEFEPFNIDTPEEQAALMVLWMEWLEAVNGTVDFDLFKPRHLWSLAEWKANSLEKEFGFSARVSGEYLELAGEIAWKEEIQKSLREEFELIGARAQLWEEKEDQFSWTFLPQANGFDALRTEGEFGIRFKPRKLRFECRASSPLEGSVMMACLLEWIKLLKGEIDKQL